MDSYIDSLIKEIGSYKDKLSTYKVSTIFLGGGTPSLLDNRNTEKVMYALREYGNISKDVEISIEANPGTISREKLKGYFDLGINRLSFGLQSCYEKHLKLMGRVHSYEEYLKNIKEARDIGFTNINTDLISALPGQTTDEWIYGLSELVKLKIPHISAYSLIIEESTPFHRWKEEGKIQTIDEEIDLNMYKKGIKFLEKHGYKHYEISNFALPNYECRHNLNYWLNGQYFGFGAGAHSNLDGQRSSNYKGIKEYIEVINKQKLPVEESERTTLKDEISETMFLGLRLIDGLSIGDFEKRFGETPKGIYGDTLVKLREQNLIKYNSKRIKLTKSGLYLSNVVFQELLLD